MDGPYEKLISIRNAMTHRFVKVKMLLEDETHENMTYESLFKQTLKLATIIRNCIINLLFFVSIEETKKEREQGSISLPLIAREIPDDQKNL